MEKQRNNNISVVIPVYNSEQIIEELNFRLIKVLDDFSERYEIIFVNDHSPDNVWEKLTELANQYSNIIAVKLRKNVGYDNAIMAGLSFVRYPIVVIMDDDLQHAPEDIIKLYEQCQKGFDICFANFEVKKQRLWKNIGSWINGKIAEVSIDKSKHLYLSPFKIMRKEIVTAICAYDGPFPYIDGLIMTVTNNFTQVAVKHHQRFSGESTYSLQKSLTVWGKHITGFSILPLRIASIVGVFAAFSGLCLGLYYIAYYFLYGTVLGWTTLTCLVLFIGGLILISLGVIGEYVGRIYLKLNNRPQYVIKDIIRPS